MQVSNDGGFANVTSTGFALGKGLNNYIHGNSTYITIGYGANGQAILLDA